MAPGVPMPSYPGAAGYGLPPPASSGSLDLSAIKPVNSGTLSIEDAIAKAKAFAAEKAGPQYGRPMHYSNDARGGGSDSRPYRSDRSRSPPSRRDAYRDNVNPYRDERRDDRGGQSRGDYGRDRSYSPHRGRPGGGYSPRGANGSGRDRSPLRGGGDDNTEIIQIESNLVGLIIGRQGENLRRVESETGCRVQFLTPPGEPGPFRDCKISGPRARRQEAKAAINRIIEDSGMGAVARAGYDKSKDMRRPSPGGPDNLREGEESMQIMVPDRTVGLIIGRGGETIRDLQERSGCHINIVGESKSVNGLRPVNLIGPHAAAVKAKDLIMEIVDSDSRSGGAGGGRPPKDHGGHRGDHGRDDRGFGGGGGPGGERVNDSIYVPSEAVGMIIGKGGETIREMQASTGCKINVSQSSGPGETEREIGLIGTRDSIARAKRAIEDKVEMVVSLASKRLFTNATQYNPVLTVSQRQKNSGGGRGGRRGDYQSQSDYDRSHNMYGSQQRQDAGRGPTQSAPPAAPAPADGAADPYAPCKYLLSFVSHVRDRNADSHADGGYQAYLALWYQALAQQQAGAQAGAPNPPGA